MTAERRRLSRRELLQLGGLVAAGYGVSVFLQATAPLGRDMSTNSQAQALLRNPGGPTEGPDDADLRVVIFTDYQCPACRKAAPDLDAAFREDGRVQLAYKDWPIFGALSEQAARVALAAHYQGIYPPIHHALMRERRQLERNVLELVVQQAGGRWDRIERDLNPHSPSKSLILLSGSQYFRYKSWC
ncbi:MULTISPECIES: thioredoxin domain-containing protein [unclassified Sphingobium]|uniref:thioredoxin domain-containing protein n=1 Tax=unclassified Sphingobium TaxID=2611147 RepID=UPI0009E7EFE3|nr:MULTISPECIES: thioredoxin domain-containing protein [unclassified Sphingobium]